MTETTEITEDISENAEASDLQKRCEELEHSYKLALADYQNLLKQTAKERKDLALYANEALIMEMLPVYDNLKQSVKHYSQEVDWPNSNWGTGVEYIAKQLLKVLEDAGVREIKTIGQHFDPLSMEAVETREADNQDQEDTVAEELKGGYKLHDKVIIPARVAVYKN